MRAVDGASSVKISQRQFSSKGKQTLNIIDIQIQWEIRAPFTALNWLNSKADLATKMLLTDTCMYSERLYYGFRQMNSINAQLSNSRRLRNSRMVKFRVILRIEINTTIVKERIIIYREIGTEVG
jgi:hypothetical protein